MTALRRLLLVLLPAAAALLSSCSSTSKDALVVSVADQKMALYRNGELQRVYGVSTSKFGLGDAPGTCATPTGKLKIAKKIGGGAPPGMVFDGRRATGKIVRPDAPGRDPIVSRILWLTGTESKNRNAYARYIYIHGTAAERDIGRPVSYGCVRMRSMDVIDLYNQVSPGTAVKIETGHLPMAARFKKEYVYQPPAGSGDRDKPDVRYANR